MAANSGSDQGDPRSVPPAVVVNVSVSPLVSGDGCGASLSVAGAWLGSGGDGPEDQALVERLKQEVAELKQEVELKQAIIVLQTSEIVELKQDVELQKVKNVLKRERSFADAAARATGLPGTLKDVTLYVTQTGGKFHLKDRCGGLSDHKCRPLTLCLTCGP